MALTSVDITTRPIKIAYLIDYGDKEKLERAISISSCLWGGAINPIIPVYKRISHKIVDGSGRKFPTVMSLVRGYIDAFDPDYFVNFSALSDADIPVPKWRVIKEEDIFDSSVIRKKAWGRSEVNYGTGIFEILDYISDREFKYQRKDTVDVYDIRYGAQYSTFFGSVFGNYSERARNAFMQRYSSTIAIKPKRVSKKNFIETLSLRLLTIRKLCNWYIDFGVSGHRQDYIFVLNPNNWQDVVDYINLKTFGLSVLPMPVSLCTTNDAVKLATEFINSNYRKYNKNQIFYETTVLKSRGCPEEVLKNFGELLPKPEEPGKFKWLYQTHYPRIWDSWARSRDGIENSYVEHKKTAYQMASSTSIKIPSLRPDIIDDAFHWWKPKFAYELSVKTYGADEFIANAFPTSIEFSDRILGMVASSDEWRFSKRGIVHLPDYQRNDINFELPSAVDLYDQWLDGFGINVHTSQPGKMAQQIVHSMGVDHLNILANEGLTKLIQRLADNKGGVNSIQFEPLWAEIQKFTAGNVMLTANNLFQWLLHKSVLEMGADIRCDNCGREAWHSLKELDKTVNCPICSSNIDVGLTDPTKQILWAYKPAGPFAVPELAQGAYTVALCLNFFAGTRDMEISPRYSFESDDASYEADFGLLAKTGWQEGEGIINIVGECKSFGLNKSTLQFKDEEIAKVIKLGRLQNNSIAVFATLNRNLKASDKKRLKKLVYRLRRARLQSSNNIDLLILTGNELFALQDLEDSWKALGGKHEQMSERINHAGIHDLCDATQQLYLGTESWSEWFETKWKLRQQALANSTVQPKR